MKMLSNEEVSLLFKDNGCILLGEYKKCSLPISYQCSCGNIDKISLDKFKRRLKRDKGCRYCGTKKWHLWQDDILRLSYGKLSRKEIMSHLPGFSYNSIKNRASVLGLQGNRPLVLSIARRGKGKKYQLDETFFDEVDLIQSYWAGFIATYGCISYKKNRLSIRLHEKDAEHLEKFKTAVGYTGPTYKITAKGISGPQVLLQCHSTHRWLDNLRKLYNITHEKLTLQPPNLDEKNAMAYIIGYIDGKGCISKKAIQLIGTKEVLTWIKDWFDCWAFSKRRMAKSRQFKTYYTYSVGGKRAMSLLLTMLSVTVPRLERKWGWVKEKPEEK